MPYYTKDDGVILSSYVGDNSLLFRKAFLLYSENRPMCLDMTYGKGVFWKEIDTYNISLYCNDIDPNRGSYSYSFDNLPDEWEGVFDFVVFDPPYMHSNKTRTVHRGLDSGYLNNEYKYTGSSQNVRLGYEIGMTEAKRVMAPGGILCVKCQDQIESGKQVRQHIDVFNYATQELDLVDEDLFVLTRTGTPMMRHPYQLHARKNNSFLWIFSKK